MKSIRRIFFSVLFASTLSGLAQGQVEPEIPRLLLGQVDGERITLQILPEGVSPVTQKLKGTRFINVEPGCIMLEAYVNPIGENEIEIRFPHDGSITTRAMKTMGVSSKNMTIAFTPSKAANQAGSIVAVTPIQTKSSEQGGTGQPATRPKSKSEGGDNPQPEAEGRSR